MSDKKDQKKDLKRTLFSRAPRTTGERIFIALELLTVVAIAGVLAFSIFTAGATVSSQSQYNSRPCYSGTYYYGDCTTLDAADLVGQLRVTPDREASNQDSSSITFSFRVKNWGIGRAEHIRLSFPIDPALRVGYSEFDDPDVWVSGLSETELTVTLPALENEQEATGNLIFRPRLNPVPEVGTRVSAVYALRYDDATGQVNRKSNGVTFTFAATSRDVSEGRTMLLIPDTLKASKGEKVTLSGSLFIPQELVNAWYTTGDGNSISLSQGHAANDGSYSLEVDTAALEPGTYQLVLYGNRSMISGLATLTVTAPAPSTPLQ
ncbi:MAG TPA: hypothetical protein VH186_00230 [Chloroflexia bacterium]|nr:hypothetical protein [Chloroflexia bacterium]